MKIGTFRALALLLAAAASSLRAQPVAAPLETGLPPLRNFTPKEYGAQGQNWDLVQDARGVVYAGNNEGALEFDGLRWRLVRTANKGTVRSLAVDAAGRVWVGGTGEIGFLEPDAAGLSRYVSVLDRVPKGERDFEDVWRTFATKDGIWFSSFRKLIRVRGNDVRAFRPGVAFHLAFRVGERIFIREMKRGLLEVVDDRLEPVPGGERFAEERIYAMLPWEPAGAILVGTRTQGLFVFYGASFRPFPTEDDAALKHDLLSCATRTADGNLALGTIEGGVHLIDARGRFLGRLAKEQGLQDATVDALLRDRMGGLWLGLDHGITRVEAGSPLTRFDDRSGLPGLVLSLHRHLGRLYAGTAYGLSRLEPGPNARFVKVPGIEHQTWAYLSLGDAMLVANSSGVYELRGGRVERVGAAGTTAFALHASRAAPGRVFVGLIDGLASMRREGERWVDEGRVAGVGENVRTLLESPDGRLWAGTYASGVLRVTFPKDALPRVERFGTAEGLPNPNHAYVVPLDGQPVFLTHRGLFRFDEAHRRFEPDPRFARLFPDGPRWVYTIADDRARRIWMQTADETRGVKEAGAAVRGADGAYRWEPTPLLPMSGIWSESVHTDEDRVVWLGGEEGVFRYDPRVAKDYSQPFSALVRRVSHPSGRTASAVVTYAENAFRFEYAAPAYDGLEATRFQVFLEGNDEGWSPWSSEGFREYTNLREGAYRFRVRARNVYGVVGEEGRKSFRVLPPWYRTIPAYLGYLLLAGALGWGLVRWRVRRVEAEKRELEFTVRKRTRELRTKNDQLEEAKARAEEASRAKSTFLANMSHELRTPLNAILGFQQLMERRRERDTEDAESLAIIARSGEHLLWLIDDVLSLAKIEAGRVSLTAEPFDLAALLDGLVDLLRTRAAAGVSLSLEAGELPSAVLGDEGRVRQVLLNLLGNALKFTKNGRVVLRARWSAGRAFLEIEDTGPGISNEELERLFQPFTQTETGRRSREGTGLGLALSRELARLMGGDIAATSVPGSGSTFRVELELPAAEASMVAGRESRRVVSLAPGQGAQRVLVVDDIAQNRLLLIRLLGVVGFEVREAWTGEEAVAEWRAFEPRLVLMDKRMPGMDGLAAARAIREEERTTGRARTAIIAISASAMEHERGEIFASGCDAFLPKPFREAALFSKIGELLGLAYVYEGDGGRMVSPRRPVPIDGARVARLPRALREELLAAFETGNFDAAAEASARVRAFDEELAEALGAAAHDFRSQEALSALQAAARTGA